MLSAGIFQIRLEGTARWVDVIGRVRIPPAERTDLTEHVLRALVVDGDRLAVVAVLDRRDGEIDDVLALCQHEFTRFVVEVVLCDELGVVTVTLFGRSDTRASVPVSVAVSVSVPASVASPVAATSRRAGTERPDGTDCADRAYRSKDGSSALSAVVATPRVFGGLVLHVDVSYEVFR